MNEYLSGWLATVRLLLIVVFATLYWLGGRHIVAIRRFGGGLTLSGGTIGIALLHGTFHWWFLLSLFAYPLVLSLGYGADTTVAKIMRRIWYGVLFGAISLLFAIPGAILLGVFQVLLAVTISVGLGVWNLLPAPEEETVIAASSVLFVPFMV